MKGIGLTVALLLSALLIPLAAAETAEGNLVLNGIATFPERSSGTTLPLAILTTEPSKVTALNATVIGGQICVYTLTFYDAGMAPLVVRQQSPDGLQQDCRPYASIDVRLKQAPLEDGGGWLALHTSDAAAASFRSDAPVDVAERGSTTYATPNADKGASNDTRLPWYFQAVPEEHIGLTLRGEVSYHAGGELRIMGPEILVKTEADGREIATGREIVDASPGVRQETFRWVVLSFGGGTIDLRTTGEVTIAAREASSITWDGPLRLASAEGTISAATTAYPFPRGQGVVLDGAFSGALDAPQNGASRLQLHGDLRSTSAGAAVIHQTSPGARGPLWIGLWILGATVLVGAGYGAVTWHPGTRALTVHLMEAVETARRSWKLERAALLVHAADEAAEARQFRKAARLYHRAAKLDPDNAVDLRMEEGVALYALRAYAKAASVFEKAADTQHISTALKWAARANVRLGKLDRAEDQLIGALESPLLLHEDLAQISSDNEFAQLREREALRLVIRSAFERMR